jgi:glucosamine-6-phosphate deaminase
LQIRTFPDKVSLGEAAAAEAASALRDTIARQGRACVVAATGASQFEFLEALVLAPDVDWRRTVFFHLDEYVGLPASHAASFRRYLMDRLADRVHPGAFHFIEGDRPDPEAEARRVGELIRGCEIDEAFVGSGENGHLAFNDPPADIATDQPYIVVRLDEACRRQQLGEGWFESLEDVPRRAISMSIRQIMKSRRILCVVPDARKAPAVRDTLTREVSPWRPASALQRHPAATVYLDVDSAALLDQS